MSKSNTYSVVCHDQRGVVTGRLEEISDTGCKLVSNLDTSDPVFPQKTNVSLNIIIDSKTGESVNVEARLTGVLRDQGTWLYRLRWPECPKFLK